MLAYENYSTDAGKAVHAETARVKSKTMDLKLFLAIQDLKLLFKLNVFLN